LQVSERLWPYAIVPRNHPCYDTKVDKYFAKWRTVKTEFPSLLCVAHNDFYFVLHTVNNWVLLSATHNSNT
jgi:hypothetical protein